MFAMLVGVAVGVAVMAGPLLWLRPQLAAVSNAVSHSVAELVTVTLTGVPHIGESPHWVATVAAAVAVCTPGLVAVTLVLLADAARSARSALMFAMIAVGLASFLLIPAGSAVLLTVAGAAAASLLLIPMLTAARIVLWAAATAVAVTHGHTLVTGTSTVVTDAAAVWSEASGAGPLPLWHLAGLVLAFAPFAAAVFAALDDK